MAIMIHHKGYSVEATPETWQAELDKLIAAHGPYDSSTRVDFDAAQQPQPTGSQLGNSTWGSTIHDAAAADRINAAQQALNDAGIRVDAGEQYYATGTRMADVGYSNQRQRLAEHSDRPLIRDAAMQLVDTIKAERRNEIQLSGADIARGLQMNGKLTLRGYLLSEHAIRGMLTRGESSAATYVFGLRDRIAEHAQLLVENAKTSEPSAQQQIEAQLRTQMRADKSHLLATLIREMESCPDTMFQLRARDGLGDIYATTSPSYGIADADLVLPSVLDSLPSDARGTVEYDATSTSWELRGYVWTPTPVDEQAVGEPFEAYSSIRGNDAGAGRLRGGGGITLLRCLNASTYAAIVAGLSRMHRRGVLLDLDTLVASSMKAIRTMVDIWGAARLITIQLPAQADNPTQLIPIEQAIPGFMRSMLIDRSSQLQAVLPGRRETHVKALAAHYDTERRNPTDVTRADLANAFTRYAQEQPFGIRRNVETQTAAWLASKHVPQYEAA